MDVKLGTNFCMYLRQFKVADCGPRNNAFVKAGSKGYCSTDRVWSPCANHTLCVCFSLMFELSGFPIKKIY